MYFLLKMRKFQLAMLPFRVRKWEPLWPMRTTSLPPPVWKATKSAARCQPSSPHYLKKGMQIWIFWSVDHLDTSEGQWINTCSHSARGSSYPSYLHLSIWKDSWKKNTPWWLAGARQWPSFFPINIGQKLTLNNEKFTLRWKYVAQIPKGRLVKGPCKPICGDCDCAIYFATCKTFKHISEAESQSSSATQDFPPPKL